MWLQMDLNHSNKHQKAREPSAHGDQYVQVHLNKYFIAVQYKSKVCITVKVTGCLI
jgi:hypothetical protein